jgi:2',3'-cyclic-nucleotide 2'-phosphodiesterase (5'-nucleotidase family)
VINPVRHGKNSVFVAQAGFYGHYLGRIIYTFNESMPFKGTIMRITSDKYGKMPLVNRSIEKINKAVDNALGAKKGVAARDILASIPADIIEKHSGQELVDYVNTHLNKSIKCFLGPQKRVIVSETASGNMVADAMRFASNADIAIQNGGGVRSGIKAGDVTLKHIYSVMPFKNDLVKVRAKGSVVIDLAERIVAKYEYGFGVVSGMQIFFNPMAPEFSRVKRVLVNNEEIDSQKYYTLATNAFLLNGGDSYTQFSKTEVIKEFEPKSIQDCIAEYISINSPFSVKTEERLKIVNE